MIARPLETLLQELDEVRPGDFWIWWWMLPKVERRALLEAMEENEAAKAG